MGKPKYVSNAGVFAKMGNPWVTNKDAVRDYGRNPAAENPDLDRYLKAGQAAKRKPDVVKVRVREKSAIADFQTKAMNLRRQINADRAKAEREKLVQVGPNLYWQRKAESDKVERQKMFAGLDPVTPGHRDK